MKKLIFLICIAALVTQFAVSQEQFADPASPTSASTYGRFGNDIDLFFSVNDWAALDISKWFGFLRMEPIELDNDWEAGLAIKFEKFYLGFYYYGTFFSGTLPNTKETTHDETGTSVTGVPLAAFRALYGITRNNNFGLLFGIGDHGIKFTINSALKTIDIPIVTAPAGYDPGSTGTALTEEANFYYRSREDSVTPKLQWGTTKDMQIGRFTTRPSASVALTVGFDEEEYGDFEDLYGNKIERDNVESFSGNHIIPVLGFDTGAVSFFKGDWGLLSFGVSDEFGVMINGEGDPDNKDGKGEGTVAWRNILTPYAVFEYQASDHFKLAAKLNVPLSFGGEGDNNYFSVGAQEDKVIKGGTDGLTGYPTLEAGFQLLGSLYDSITGKTTILSRFVLNWGIKANLPNYTNQGTYTENPTKNGDNTSSVVYTTDKKKEWSTQQIVQTITAGLSFYITEKAILDAGVDISASETTPGDYDAKFKATISVKY